MLCGGTGDQKLAGEGDEVHALIAEVKDKVEAKTGATYAVFEAVAYKTQVVAGTNYFVKVKVGDDDHLHVRIYKDLQDNKEVSGVQTGKKHEDPVDYFDAE